MTYNTQQSWLHLTMVQLGGALCLPVIMVGQSLATTYGCIPAITAIMIGNMLLMIVGMILVRNSFAARTSTVETAAYFLGTRASGIFALTMILSMTGWFALQLAIIGGAAQKMLQLIPLDISLTLIIGILGTCILGMVSFGIKGIASCATVTAPLLALTVGCALYKSLIGAPNPTGGIAVASNMSALGAVSLVISIALAAVIDIPTYYRHARSLKDGTISIILLFIVAIPLIEMAGVALGLRQTGTLIDILAAQGGLLWLCLSVTAKMP